MNPKDIKNKINEHFSLLKEYDNQIQELKKKKENQLEQVQKWKRELNRYYFQNNMCLSCQSVFDNTAYPVCEECLETDECLEHKNYDYLLGMTRVQISATEQKLFDQYLDNLNLKMKLR